MVKPARPPANAFVAAVRKIYNPIGFSKGYNFVLFFIFAGALMGFTLARFQYLDYYGIFCGDPGIGECYFYTRGVAEYGLLIHLATILPAGFLVVFQFVPAIRHKFILVHRINGYIILALSLVATVGAFLAARNAFGGGLDSQVAAGVLGIMFVGSLTLGYINITRLQLEQHRAWMLRAWFYVRLSPSTCVLIVSTSSTLPLTMSQASSIITVRLIQIIMAMIISSGGTGEYWAARQCAQVDYTLGENQTRALYPDCEAFYSGEDPYKHTLIKATMNEDAMTAGATLGLSFGPAIWLGLTLHAVGIEVYVSAHASLETPQAALFTHGTST
jgi:hypothetical protein